MLTEIAQEQLSRIQVGFRKQRRKTKTRLVQKIAGDMSKGDVFDQMLNIEQLTSKEQLKVLQKIFVLVQHPQGIRWQDLSTLEEFLSEFVSDTEDPALQALEEKVKDLMLQRNEEREFSQVTTGEKRSYFQTGWQKAVKYALKHAHNYNPEYKDWDGEGGDCANFVSQALRAGGLAMHAKGRSIQDQDL